MGLAFDKAGLGFEGIKIGRSEVLHMVRERARCDKTPSGLLPTVIYKDCVFYGRDIFDGITINHLKFLNCKFFDYTLRGARIGVTNNFLGCKFEDIWFANSNIRGVNFSGSVFDNCYFGGADLRDCLFERCKFTSPDLEGALLRGANFSQSTGLLDPYEWMSKNFKRVNNGFIVYKAFGDTFHRSPESWEMQEGKYIREVPNYCRTQSCGCGVNFATREWIKNAFSPINTSLWSCLLHWHDLASLVVPYNTDGKARCGRLQLIEEIEPLVGYEYHA